MSGDCLRLTVYFGESDRAGGRLLSDALVDAFEAHGLRAAVLLRAFEGFGLKQRLRTERFLSLSEDLPLVALAIDRSERIEAALPAVTALVGDGLVTLERARLLGAASAPPAAHEEAKLTILLGRDERAGGRPAFLAAVDHLHRAGLAGATVLLGVDGLAHGRRERARFFGRNDAVPVLIVSVGAGEAVARAVDGLRRLLPDAAAVLERVRVCKRDGILLAEPEELPSRDARGLGVWQKLTVYAGEQARHGGRPRAVELVRRLREQRASGATSLLGVWGFSGDHAPHGDRLLRVRRRVPFVTTVVDSPAEIRRWFAIVDECTDETGLVTCETVPAFRAAAAQGLVGGLILARPPGRPG